ncbi:MULTISPECIES: ABC transporter permease [unclassified Microbacterium]|uniref:ABC transporter permease n=1 Tax=unclassified Microbacterium TaxID=2609290 RepID=UPI00246869CE|nr:MULTISPECIES: ABC transporter permease [unclassified Microbacterium]MDH5134489.1 ABC transporter permease [Microbacterium sp. RD10]MDH5138550.1 ABC transporter permease [Microbacterium sp. RD11]MDH5144660.1 ABC transporter permease [Microbacterium sp. RD12]MDH5155430.1 ABC transporter permease [Microbacterium sp. RD06]MDH5167992.1 ABC transporter permease [Microbacterium sp. RD02]
MADTLTLALRSARPRRRVAVASWIPLALLAIIVLACVLAPLLAPYDPAAQSSDRFAGPSAAHLFGTDELGRDLFSRVLYGGQLTVFIAGGATLVAMVLGIAWGMAAAFGRGWVDEILMRLADTVMAIPQILFALVFISAFGADPVKLAVIIGVLLTPTTARLVRSSVLSELQEDYFTAAVAFGSTRRRLLFAEVLPNAKGPIVVQAAINAANAILLEASMSFVGLGIAPPEATWGTLVQQGYQKMYQSIGYVLFPALFIFVTIWLLNVLADQFGGDRKGRGR